MSRETVYRQRCDVCGAKIEVSSKSASKLPDDWLRLKLPRIQAPPKRKATKGRTWRVRFAPKMTDTCATCIARIARFIEDLATTVEAPDD